MRAARVGDVWLRGRLYGALIAALALGGYLAPPANAADFTWSGKGPSTAWSQNGNWLGGSAPAASSSIGTLTFPSLPSFMNSENDLAGSLSVQWFYLPKGAKLAKKVKPVLVASGKATFSKAGAGHIRLRLTGQARRLLKHAKRLKLMAKGTFVASGGSVAAATMRLPLMLTQATAKRAVAAHTSGSAGHSHPLHSPRYLREHCPIAVPVNGCPSL